MTDLSETIQHALNAVEDLDLRFRDYDYDIGSIPKLEKDLLGDKLEKLLLRRIDIPHAFELLLRIDQDRAINILLRRYIGKNVSPDRKFGGYESELSLMLSDLVEIHTAEALAALVRSPEFDQSKLQDPRVVRSFSEALSIEDSDLTDWIATAVDAV